MTILCILISPAEPLGELDVGSTSKYLSVLQDPPLLPQSSRGPPRNYLLERHCFASRQYIVRCSISLHLRSMRRTLIRRLCPWNRHLPSGELFPFLRDVDSLPFLGNYFPASRRSKIRKKLFLCSYVHKRAVLLPRRRSKTDPAHSISCGLPPVSICSRKLSRCLKTVILSP